MLDMLKNPSGYARALDVRVTRIPQALASWRMARSVGTLTSVRDDFCNTLSDRVIVSIAVSLFIRPSLIIEFGNITSRSPIAIRFAHVLVEGQWVYARILAGRIGTC